MGGCCFFRSFSFRIFAAPDMVIALVAPDQYVTFSVTYGVHITHSIGHRERCSVTH